MLSPLAEAIEYAATAKLKATSRLANNITVGSKLTVHCPYYTSPFWLPYRNDGVFIWSELFIVTVTAVSGDKIIAVGDEEVEISLRDNALTLCTGMLAWDVWPGEIIRPFTIISKSALT